jgi:hypothetical protein
VLMVEVETTVVVTVELGTPVGAAILGSRHLQALVTLAGTLSH